MQVFKIIFVLQSLFDFIQLLFRNFRHLQNLFPAKFHSGLHVSFPAEFHVLLLNPINYTSNASPFRADRSYVTLSGSIHAYIVHHNVLSHHSGKDFLKTHLSSFSPVIIKYFVVFELPIV